MDSRERSKVHGTLPALLVLLGFLLMFGKMYAEGEPGGIPALLIALGAGWHLTSRIRMRSQRK
jgi:hypothetical protein